MVIKLLIYTRYSKHLYIYFWNYIPKASVAVCLVLPDECIEGQVKQKQVIEISISFSVIFAEVTSPSYSTHTYSGGTVMVSMPPFE